MVMLAAQLCSAQVLVRAVNENKLTEIDAQFMQKGYKLAYSQMTSEEYLFKGNEQKWKAAWVSLMQNLSTFMQQKGMVFNAGSTCYFRIYFNANGTIDACLYEAKGIAETTQFEKLLIEFCLNNKVQMPATQTYWQYGTLNFN